MASAEGRSGGRVKSLMFREEKVVRYEESLERARDQPVVGLARR